MTEQELLNAAKTGDIGACCTLGEKYATGDGVPQNYNKAIEYYQIAADKGDSGAIYSLAYCHLFGLNDSESHRKGIELMKQAAEMGVATANEHMGWIYFRNQFAPVDYDKSFMYMKKAADLGDAIAQSHVAQAYENGFWGAPEQDFTMSKHYYNLALAQGNDHAHWAVVENYLGGYNGYPLDIEKAVDHFRKGAENGSHRAQLSLALCYYNGNGVPKNMTECGKWLKAASERGNAEAQWRLGYFLVEGIGMPKDIVTGKMWLQQSAEQGDKQAIELLQEVNKVLTQQSTNHSANTTSSGGCYVATAVYGSYDCPQVWTLRRFRDDVLASSFAGRLFIRTYYAISPTLVKWFGHCNWFRNLWKPTLDRMVKKLNDNGTEDTPYCDRNW